MYSRPLIICWVFSCMIVTTCFKANISSTSIRAPEQADQTIKDLIEKNYSIAVGKRNMEYAELLKMEFPKAVFKTYANVSYTQCDATSLLFTHKVLMVTTIEAFIENLISCPNITDNYNLNDVGEITLYSLIANSWMLPNYHPLTEMISRSKLRFVQNGIYWHWMWKSTKNKIWQLLRYPKLLRRLKDGQVRPLRLDDVMAPLIIWAVGMMLASVCFVAELVYYRLSTNIRQRRRCRHSHIEFTL